jgi:hypothetical protein
MGSSKNGIEKEIKFDIVLEPAGGEVSYRYDSDDEAAVKAFIHSNEVERGNASTVADEIARALAPQLRRLLRPTLVPPDDAYVDQDAGLFPREVYLRLARKKYFSVTKEGQARVARWGDVKAGRLERLLAEPLLVEREP